MKAAEAVVVGYTQDPLNLQVEAVIRWWLVPGVQLQILRHRVAALAEHLEQRGICRLGRQHHTWQQHDLMAGRHERDPTPRYVPGYTSRSAASEMLSTP